MTYVLTPDDLDWTELDKPGHPNTGFFFTPSVIDKEFTDVYSAQLGRIQPGKGSTPHLDPSTTRSTSCEEPGRSVSARRNGPCDPARS
jgi:hypothetical protein